MSEEYGEEFQTDILRAFASDPSFFLTAAQQLAVRDFDSVWHRLVFGTMMRHREVFNEAPAAGSFRNEVADEIKAIRSDEPDPLVPEVSEDDERRAFELVDVVVEALRSPDRSGTKYWQSKLPGFVAQQRVRDLRDDMTVLEQVQVARRIANDADSIATAGDIEILDDEGYDVDSEFTEEAGLEKGMRWGTGIWPFDRRMGGGGLLRGQVGAISAPTGLGKSTIMTNIAANMAINGYYSLFVSLEDKVETVRNRYAAIVGNFDATCTQEPKPKWPEEIKREYRFVYSRESPVHGMLSIVNGSGSSPSCSKIEKMIEQWQNVLRERGVPDDRVAGVFVDYVSRVSHEGLKIKRDPSLYERELAIMEELARISERRSVVLWTAVQANREAIKKNNVGKDGVANSVGALFPCAAAFGVTVPKKPGETDSSTMDDEHPYDVRTSGREQKLTRCDRKLRVNVIKMREAATEDQVFYVYQGPSLRIWTNDHEARQAERWARENNRLEMYAVMRK